MRAVKRRKIHEDTVRLLGDRQNESQKPLFGSMREAFVFAAYLGFDAGNRGKIEGETYEIDSRIIERNLDALNAIDLIALSTTNDLNILNDDREEERIAIFEEFADGGFQILDEWLKASPSDTFGDQAIISGMKNSGYLADDLPKDADAAMNEAEF